MSDALKNIKTSTETDQRTPALGKNQVRNNAGGYVFKVTDETRLDRFLIMGTDGGTFYQSEAALTEQNAAFLTGLITGGSEALVRERVREVSVAGRAKSRKPALFAVAALLTFGEDKAQTRELFQEVVRTGTDLFTVSTYIKNLGGWGRAKRGAIKDWYESKDTDALAYQMVKYRQRDGWTHGDLLRVSHARPATSLARFALGKDDVAGEKVPALVEGFRAAQKATDGAEAVKVLNEYKNLPWESLPTETLRAPEVWQTLFENGQLRGQALIRNITRLARLGLLHPLNNPEFTQKYAAAIADPENIKRGRVHPISYLLALVTYTEGQTPRGALSGWGYASARSKDWETAPVIKDALTKAFYASFGNVEATGKSTLVALDVSGSMEMNANGIDLSCAQVGAAVAMTVARTEPASIIRGFTAGKRGSYGSWGRAAELTDLGITGSTALPDAMRAVRNQTFGATDCAQPMLWALENNVKVESFVVITDNETYFGNVHPFAALKKYRAATGIDARLAVLGVASTEFSIADPSDAGMADFVGFDAGMMTALREFLAGNL